MAKKKSVVDPCFICLKKTNVNNSLSCHLCKNPSHKKCNYLNKEDFTRYKQKTTEFFCLKCKENIIPFSKLNNQEFNSLSIGKTNSEVASQTNFKSSQFQCDIIEKINSQIEEHNSDIINNNFEDEPVYNHLFTCNYYDVNEFFKCNFKSSTSFSMLHLNIHSIQLHIDEFCNLLDMLNHSFDIITISESKLKTTPTTNIEIPGYQSPCLTYTEAEKGGTMIYVRNGINFKLRKDLEIYNSKELESTFIEIVNQKESNSIVGVIYRHPKMDPNDFIDNKL